MTEYAYTHPFMTRWNDNDVYGHLNNTIYYAAMDTTITTWLIQQAGFGAETGDELAVCVASSCRYVESGAFPETLSVGLRAGRLGTTSVTWELGIFRESDGVLLAEGQFTHVFVGREGRRPVPVPTTLRQLIEAKLMMPDAPN